LFFNADGTIQKVTQTLRGIGVTAAVSPIQLDRYSQISDTGASVAFLDTADKFKGWKTVLDAPGAWVRYNSVDFGAKKLKAVEVKALSANGATVQLRLSNATGPVIAEIKIPKSSEWKVLKTPVTSVRPGVHHLVAVLKGPGEAELDWLRFQ
jgi:hypothetical protein